MHQIVIDYQSVLVSLSLSLSFFGIDRCAAHRHFQYCTSAQLKCTSARHGSPKKCNSSHPGKNIQPNCLKRLTYVSHTTTAKSITSNIRPDPINYAAHFSGRSSSRRTLYSSIDELCRLSVELARDTAPASTAASAVAHLRCALNGLKCFSFSLIAQLAVAHRVFICVFPFLLRQV